MKDVAERVGVSVSAVSAILNESSQACRFSETTVKAVVQAARELGYAPNRLARTLKGEQTKLVGVVTLNRQRSFYTLPLQTANHTAAAQGYELVQMDLGNDPAGLPRAIASLLSWRVEGLLLLTGNMPLTDAVRLMIQRAGLPCVRAGLFNPDDPCHTILFDNVESGRLLARHLLDLGHRSIGIIAGSLSNEQEAERIAGIREVSSARGLPDSALEVFYADTRPPDLETGYCMCQHLRGTRAQITAVCCLNDLLAVGALRYLHDSHCPVPAKVSLTGFDDVLLESFIEEHNRLGQYLYPRLTTIRGPFEELGRRGIEMILTSLSDAPPLRYNVVTVMPQLIVRESTAPPGS